MKADSQYNWFQNVTLDENGNQNVVQHSHPNSITAHIHLSNITTTSDYVFIDISDTVNYGHVGTNYAHIEHAWVSIDADTNADYQVTVGYLKDVTTTGGTFVHLYTVSGTKKAGNSKDVILPVYPNGGKLNDAFVVTADLVNSSDYANTNTLPSTLSPATPDTNPNNGDVVLNIVMNAGSINLALNTSYHAH